MSNLFDIDTISYCIFGIPAYTFCAFLGLTVAICAYIMLMASKQYDLSGGMKMLFLSLLGMAVGAKLFGFMTGIYRDIGLGRPVTLEAIGDTGIVYYGGLLGLTAVYSRGLRRKQSTLDANALDVLAVCCPLFHSIARIGCFLSGCCYGKVHDGFFAVGYTIYIDGAVDVNMRIPVQLMESVFEFLVFLYLLSLLRRTDWRSGRICLRYFAIYSAGRFFLEFLRGDIRRGVIGNVSFSQCISVIIWCVLAIHCLKHGYFKITKEDFHAYNTQMDS